jgi:hypothetical protein
MTESNVIYIPSNISDAGAVPRDTDVATHALTSKIPLSLNYVGNAGDIITVSALRVSINATVGAALEWREIR